MRDPIGNRWFDLDAYLVSELRDGSGANTERADEFGASHLVSMRLSEPGMDRRLLRLELVPWQYAVGGVVRDGYGRPIEGAEITMEPRGRDTGVVVRNVVVPTAQVERVLTDRAGGFRIRLNRGSIWRLDVSADGFCSSRRRVNVVGDRNDLDLVLLPAVSLTGVVRSEAGGIVPGAEISVLRPSGEPWRTASGADGSYRLDGFSLRNWRTSEPERKKGGGIRMVDKRYRDAFLVEVVAPGFVPLRRSFAEAAPGDDVSWDPTLEAGFEVSGRVEFDDGTPCAGWTVRWRTPEIGANKFLSMRERDVLVDDEGRFEVRGCGPGRYQLLVLSPDLGMVVHKSVLELGEAEEPLITIPLRCVPSSSIAARVVDSDGAPASWVTMSVTHVPSQGLIWREWLGSDGRAELGPLPPGDYHISVSGDVGEGSTSLGRFLLEPGQRLDFGDVLLTGTTRKR